MNAGKPVQIKKIRPKPEKGGCRSYLTYQGAKNSTSIKSCCVIFVAKSESVNSSTSLATESAVSDRRQRNIFIVVSQDAGSYLCWKTKRVVSSCAVEFWLVQISRSDSRKRTRTTGLYRSMPSNVNPRKERHVQLMIDKLIKPKFGQEKNDKDMPYRGSLVVKNIIVI